jgi:hypothetical protein
MIFESLPQAGLSMAMGQRLQVRVLWPTEERPQ